MATPEQVIAGHQASVAAVRAHVLAYARLVWRAQGSYRTADVDRIVALLVPRVQAGQLQTAQLTSAYIATIATMRTGLLVKPTPVDPADVLNGRGVDAAEVYRRPAVEVYTALGAGASYTDAVARGITRLDSLVSTDMQMSKVRQARSSFEANRITGYRRVLTGGSNCAMCVIASTQRYHSRDLLPIHPGCDCGVDELRGETGQVIDPELLGQAHAAVADSLGFTDRSGRSVDFRKLVLVRNHGEYGPTLTLRAHRFTGPQALETGIDFDALGVQRAV